MAGRKVEIYIDLKFLEGYFKNLNGCDTLSEEFEIYYSFFKIIQQNHIRLISLESGKTINANDVVRVYHSTFKAINSDIEKYQSLDYSKIRNPQTIFLGELFGNKCDELSKEHGFVFTNLATFAGYWKKLLLIGSSRTIHIKPSEHWENIFKPYSLPSNSVLFIDQYLGGWLEHFDENHFDDNFYKTINSLLQTTKQKILVITCDFPWSSIEARIKNSEYSVSVLSFGLKALDNLKQKGKTLSRSERNTNGIWTDDQRNLFSDIKMYIHDRYIITNYYLIISTHSFDYTIDGKITKDTQLIVEPLLDSSFNEFYTSKLKSYLRLFEWLKQPSVKTHINATGDSVTFQNHFCDLPDDIR